MAIRNDLNDLNLKIFVNVSLKRSPTSGVETEASKLLISGNEVNRFPEFLTIN